MTFKKFLSIKNLKLVSFDIKNMYSNIPTKDLIELLIYCAIRTTSMKNENMK